MAVLGKSHRAAACFVIAALAATVLGGCKSTFGNQYNTKQEVALGQKMANEVEKEDKVDTDPALNARIDGIATKIFAQARLVRPDVTYRIKVLDDKEVNAFSLPGGWIYIDSALIEKAGSDDDALACVIGHETAHVVLRHAVRQISDATDKGILVDILGVLTDAGNAYQATSLVYELDQLHYSRQDEYQADKYGLMFAYNAGYDPNGMPRFFKILQADEKNGEGQTPWAEDHPITRNRIARANQLIQILEDNNGTYPPGSDGGRP